MAPIRSLTKSDPINPYVPAFPRKTPPYVKQPLSVLPSPPVDRVLPTMRNKILNLKVSEEELADVKRRAGTRRVSEYVRELIFPEDVEQREAGQVTLTDQNFTADRAVQSGAELPERLIEARVKQLRQRQGGPAYQLRSQAIRELTQESIG